MGGAEDVIAEDAVGIMVVTCQGVARSTLYLQGVRCIYKEFADLHDAMLCCYGAAMVLLQFWLWVLS